MCLLKDSGGKNVPLPASDWISLGHMLVLWTHFCDWRPIINSTACQTYSGVCRVCDTEIVNVGKTKKKKCQMQEGL